MNEADVVKTTSQREQIAHRLRVERSIYADM